MKEKSTKITKITYGLGDDFESELLGFIAVVFSIIGFISIVVWLTKV